MNEVYEKLIIGKGSSEVIDMIKFGDNLYGVTIKELFDKNKKLEEDIDNEKNDYRELFSNYICLQEKNVKLKKENEQLKSERRNDAKEFSALFKQNLRLKRENDKLKKEIKNDWVCGCCKHFHLGIKDRCDKGHNWILKDESCQDFERVGCGMNEW